MKQDLSEYIFNANNDPFYIFSPLTQEQLKALKESSIKRYVKKGKTIFRESQSPKGLIYLVKGSAKLYKYGRGEREQIVRLVKPHTFVGYKALFAEKAHTTTAETLENSEIIIYKKEELFSVIDNNPKFSRLIIKILANELAFNYNRIINLTQKHLRGRLAETLLFVKDIFGLESDGKTIKAKLTRENLAHFSNMTTSNAIRTLRKFEEENLVKTEGKKIILQDEIQLSNISNLA